MPKRQLLLCLLFCFSTYCYGQGMEVAVLTGGVFSPNSVGGFDSGIALSTCPATSVANCPAIPNCSDCLAPSAAASGIAIEGVAAHRIFNLHLASLYLELPVMSAPNRGGNTGGGNFSGLFFTPAIRAKISLPIISPFLSIGGGFAHFAPHNTLAGPSATKGAFQVGGGIDIKTPIPVIGLRAEVRDFRTSSFANTEHNIFVGGGIVFRLHKNPGI